MAKKQETQDRAAAELADPGQQKLTKVSAARLGAISGFEAERFAGATVAEIGAKYGHLIDPHLLFFRRVCGKVVKTDPSTGIQYPVPYASVFVEDTDTSLLGFFPFGWDWGWYFPYNTRREVIAQTRTDACGNFCVWVPRWDIDWILRWRLERVCYPVVFERPNLGDIIKQVFPERIPRPHPDPDPGPLVPGVGPVRAGGADVARSYFENRLVHAVGSGSAATLLAADTGATFGSTTVELDAALSAPAFGRELTPPLPDDLTLALLDDRRSRDAGTDPAASGAVAQLAAKLGLDRADIDGVDLRSYIGPFKRCVDRFVPQWVPIFDVPDVTFRVTQDVNGDGVEDPIYSESFFQVRWDDTSTAPVTLQAGPQARAGLLCGPHDIPCGDVPEIVMAGMMPVLNNPGLWDATNGVSVLTNRPRNTGSFAQPASGPGAAPLAGGVTLYGCNRTDPQATKYRLRYEFSGNGGVTFDPPASFVGLTWLLSRPKPDGTPEYLSPTADVNGWYPILPDDPNPWEQTNVLLYWPTYNFGDGLYRITMELDTDTVAHPAHSQPIAFAIDNSAPTALLTVEWSTSNGTSWTPLGGICPVVRRGTTPSDLYFRVTLTSAAAHLRSTQLWPGDCGDGSFAFVSGSGGIAAADGTYERWHEAINDDTASLQVVYRLDSTVAEGTYSFHSDVASRAFNPQGADDGPIKVPPFAYDPEVLHIQPSFAFSVINAVPLP